MWLSWWNVLLITLSILVGNSISRWLTGDWWFTVVWKLESHPPSSSYFKGLFEMMMMWTTLIFTLFTLFGKWSNFREMSRDFFQPGKLSGGSWENFRDQQIPQSSSTPVDSKSQPRFGWVATRPGSLDFRVSEGISSNLRLRELEHLQETPRMNGKRTLNFCWSSLKPIQWESDNDTSHTSWYQCGSTYQAYSWRPSPSQQH